MEMSNNNGNKKEMRFYQRSNEVRETTVMGETIRWKRGGGGGGGGEDTAIKKERE